MVKATDGGSLPLSSAAVVKINVTDENDNTPSFVHPSHQLSIQEDVATNTTVVQVSETIMHGSCLFYCLILWIDILDAFQVLSSLHSHSFCADKQACALV